MVGAKQFSPDTLPKQQPKILVVDDLQENHRAFNRVLNNLDASIYSATSGREAIALTLRHHFAVILLDVMMPEMDGYETAEIIRVNEESKSTPIIFITALDRSEEFEERGYGTGAVDYLFKPVKPSTLTSKIKIFVELEAQRLEIRKSVAHIRRLKMKNDLILRSVGEGILGLDQFGCVSFSNPAAQAMLGYSEEGLSEQAFMDIVRHSGAETIETSWTDSEIYRKCIQEGDYKEHIGVFLRSNGTPVPVEYLVTPILSTSNKRVLGFVIAFLDITERQKTEEKLVRLAQVDTLTGLNNRHSFSKLLDQAIARSNRQKSEIALLFIDLDKFKQVNDNLGHETGDAVLKEASKRLFKCIRDGDTLSRLGGDEFSIILEAMQNEMVAATVSNKILNELNVPFSIGNYEINVSASVGIAVYPKSASSAEDLLRCADIAMYRAKQAGRNNFQFFTEKMQLDVSYELALENALRLATERKEFFLHYQPKVDPVTKKILGTEALIRWVNSDGENVSPSQFIPKAEETGLINAIGTWVLEHGCCQLKRWQDSGMVEESHVISVNLSMRQLVRNDLCDLVKTTLEKTKLAASCLELEITESMMMIDPDLTISTLKEISKLGVKVSIDDFGTGYSSLSYLRKLPISSIKIDRSFVQAIGIPSGDAIVNTIISLGRNLGLSIVAEGVETYEQVKFLTDNQVDLIQGFYFSKPMEGKGYERFLVEGPKGSAP